ncbi:GldG family protein [Chakrabartyella piscis]|uniref:GldG family protein n=1 Tax=Chakrabartyella piscis TaxID=2918914 RepID=UPI00295874A4|nr:GldG family protein [Chakrabartyella piscis]
MKQLSNKKIYSLIGILAVVIFVLFNLLFGQLGEQYSTKIDLTDNGLYDLSEETELYVGRLDTPITITVLAAEEEYPSMLVEILERYTEVSGQIQIAYKDPYENPTLLETYRQKGINLGESDILVTQDAYAKHITFAEILVEENGSVTGIQLEQVLTSAILNLAVENKPQVLFTLGHNESITTSLESLFVENNFETTQAALSATNIEEAALVVIANPKGDFQVDEIQMLENFLAEDGKIIMMCEPGIEEMPNLEALLAKWNIGLGDSVVLESQAYISNNPLNIIPMYGSHEINRYFMENPIYMTLPSSRNLEQLANATGSIQTTAVLLSTSDSYGKSAEGYDTTAKEDGDVTGPFALSLVSEKEGAGAILVLGSGKSYADDILSVSSYANKMFFTQVATYFNDDVVAVSIPAKTTVIPPLVMASNTILMIGIVFGGILPVLIILLGLVKVLKRKKL